MIEKPPKKLMDEGSGIRRKLDPMCRRPTIPRTPPDGTGKACVESQILRPSIFGRLLRSFQKCLPRLICISSSINRFFRRLVKETSVGRDIFSSRRPNLLDFIAETLTLRRHMTREIFLAISACSSSVSKEKVCIGCKSMRPTCSPQG